MTSEQRAARMAERQRQADLRFWREVEEEDREKIEAAFAEGLAAAKRGETGHSCPYCSGMQRPAWFDGWMAFQTSGIAVDLPQNGARND